MGKLDGYKIITAGLVGVTTCAASAGSYCYGDGDQDSGSSYIDATEDICPKNWRMPSLNWDDGDYDVLMQEYGNSLVASNINSLQYNLSTPLSGFSVVARRKIKATTGAFILPRLPRRTTCGASTRVLMEWARKVTIVSMVLLCVV